MAVVDIGPQVCNLQIMRLVSKSGGRFVGGLQGLALATWIRMSGIARTRADMLPQGLDPVLLLWLALDEDVPNKFSMEGYVIMTPPKMGFGSSCWQQLYGVQQL